MSEKKHTIKVQLLIDGKMFREFEIDTPERVSGVHSDSEYLRAVWWYERLEKVMK